MGFESTCRQDQRRQRRVQRPAADAPDCTQTRPAGPLQHIVGPRHSHSGGRSNRRSPATGTEATFPRSADLATPSGRQRPTKRCSRRPAHRRNLWRRAHDRDGAPASSQPTRRRDASRRRTRPAELDCEGAATRGPGTRTALNCTRSDQRTTRAASSEEKTGGPSRLLEGMAYSIASGASRDNAVVAPRCRAHQTQRSVASVPRDVDGEESKPGGSAPRP